jgi:hypothetical protein
MLTGRSRTRQTDTIKRAKTGTWRISTVTGRPVMLPKSDPQLALYVPLRYPADECFGVT